MPSEIAALYRASKKKQDINWFTEWIARPPAAVVVYAIRNTPLTPNQVTFGSAIVAAGACAMFALCPGWLWLVVAALIFEFSFVLDCADGMLARLRKIASPIGHQLDFLMDELKAMLLYGCVTVRMWRDTGDERYLIIGIFAGFCLASGIALTSFMRRPEYGGGPAVTEDGQPAQVGKRGGPIGLALNTFEWAARVVVHYPQYLWLVAAVNRIDIYFWAYAGVNVLYFGMSMLKILLKLGRFAK
jgi:phosphatidylglycerophosphate synthase